MKNKKLALCAAFAAASMIFAVPAMAKEYTNTDGNITIDLPNDDWHEVGDPSAEFAFTNGVDVISAKKYAPEDKVEFTRNDKDYNAVLQFSYAYSDQLFVLTAQVADASNLADVYQSVTSIKFNGITPKNEAKKDVNNYSVAGADETMYVNAWDGLNLRENFSVESNVMTTIPYGASLHVIGIVQLNGENIGWDKVEYEGMTGYVSSASLVSAKPVVESNPTFEEIVDEVSYYEFKYDADGNPVKVVVLNNGTILDMNGNKVTGFADCALQMYDGTIIYDFDPTQMSIDDYINGGGTGRGDLIVDTVSEPEYNEVGGMVLYNEYGSTSIIFQEQDGTWYDINGNEFWQNEAGIWFNTSDHSEWYN
ncbi:MAG: SH3 domain-containing protein [Blautia sp.]|nr:SH3 domain-containing protein [Blautia sp.]